MFYLAYGGLHWSPDQVLDMTPEMRTWFCERLQRQKDHEEEQAKKARKK
jgi:hypothetical protein